MRTEVKPVKSRLRPPAGSFSKWGQAICKMPPAKRIEMIRSGVKVALLVGAGQYYGLSQTSLSKLVGVSDATITRKIKPGTVYALYPADHQQGDCRSTDDTVKNRYALSADAE